MDNRIIITGEKRVPKLLPLCGKDAAGNLYEVDNISMLKNGRRFLPVMGEFHYSRWEPEGWEEELYKMKAGGLDAVATYVFWIHHEEREGEWEFTGCRDLRKFLQVCQKVGILVWLRIGPWAHGECRNGGFPDWLVKRCGENLRSNDPVYLEAVRKFYHEIGVQVRGMMISEGGPILGIQLENEYGHCGGGPSEWEELKAHMLTLKQMAQDEGMIVPYYTSTGWGGGVVVDGETIPVLGGYVDAPWAGHVQEMPASANFVFSPYKQDENIGADLKRLDSRSFTFDPSINPYFTAELGGGMQVTSHRRVYVYPEDIEAQTLTMLGSGANLLGYYMYHGGINPDGKDSTYQESRATGYANDLPIKSYDFETCIRESGELRGNFARLRKLHTMIKEIEEPLAGSTVYFAEKNPTDPEDMETLRVTARVCEDGSGFLFVNNHQRKRQMKERVNASVGLIWPDREVVIDRLNLKSGECAVIPFDLRMKAADCAAVRDDGTMQVSKTLSDGKETLQGGGCSEVILERTNASLLCHIGSRYFFCTDAEPFYQWKDGKAAEVITLTVDQANRACKLRNMLCITEHEDSCLIEKENGIWLISSHETEKITVFHEDGRPVDIEISYGKVSVDVQAQLVQDCLTEKAAAIGYGVEEGAAASETGSRIPHMPTDYSTEYGYRDYLVRIGDFEEAKVSQLYLETDYIGDRVEVYQNGRLIDDWFTTGEPWHMALKRFGYPGELVLRIYSTDSPIPNPHGDQVYYDLELEKGCGLRGVKVIPEYRARLG